MKKLSVLMVTVLIITGLIGSVAVATTYNTTHWYSCGAHSNCMYVTFTSSGNTSTGQVYDEYFSASYTHWPNGVTYDNTWSYTVGTTGYAKGTYTIYSSLITQWASLAFQSQTRTMTHVY